MEIPYVATIGSISHGALLTGDLIFAFAWELRSSRLTRAERKTVNAANRWLALDEDERDDEAGGYLVEELSDILGAYAPECCYFGTAEGDGSDFGFWPSLDRVNELPRIAEPDPKLARAVGETCVYVNDHGNVTVFSGHGRRLWDCV